MHVHVDVGMLHRILTSTCFILIAVKISGYRMLGWSSQRTAQKQHQALCHVPEEILVLQYTGLCAEQRSSV